MHPGDRVGKEPAASAAVASPVTDTDDTKSSRKSAFAGLSFSAEFEGGGHDDDDDGDNLMVCKLSLVFLSLETDLWGTLYRRCFKNERTKRKTRRSTRRSTLMMVPHL